MRKLIVLLGMVLLFTSLVYAQERMVVEQIISATADSIKIPGTMTTYSKSFSLRDASRLAAIYQTDSTSTVNYNVVLQQSYRLPTTEGSYDAAYVTTDALRGVITNKLWIIATIDSLTALPYGRFKIDSTGNADDAVIQLEIGKQ